MAILKFIGENLIREYETWKTEFPPKDVEIIEYFGKKFTFWNKKEQTHKNKNRIIWKRTGRLKNIDKDYFINTDRKIQNIIVIHWT